MAFAIEMYFDSRADAVVREVWAALECNGIRSTGSGPVANARPHVSLAVFESGMLEGVEQTLRSRAAQVRGLRLTFPSLGFFLTAEAVAFLGVTPTAALLQLHRAVADSLAPLVSGYWSYYLPDAWTPHCTIASGAHDHAAIVASLAHVTLPIHATVESVGVLEVPRGLPQFTIDVR